MNIWTLDHEMRKAILFLIAVLLCVFGFWCMGRAGRFSDDRPVSSIGAMI